MAINRTQKPLALPPSDKEAAAKAAPVVERVISEDKSSATLIGVIRDSSKLTVAKLEAISRDLTGIRKENAAFVKSLEPMVRYYQKKWQRYAALEEEYFKQAVKGFAKRQGVSDKFPDSSSVFKAESTRSVRGEPAPSTTPTGATFKTAFADVMAGLKTVNSYAQAPIKLIDTAVAGIIALPLSIFRKNKDKAAKQAASEAEADAQNKRETEASRVAAEKAGEKIDDQNNYFERLEQVLRDVFKAEEAEEAAQEEETGLVPYEEDVEPPPVVLVVDQMMVGAMVVGEVIFGSPMGPGSEDDAMRVIDDAEVTFTDASSELADSVRAITENIPSADLFQSAFGVRERTSYEAVPAEPLYYGSYRNLQITGPTGPGTVQPDSSGSGPGGPSGFFAGKDDAEDATFTKDLADDSLDAWEAMLGPVLDFYAAPDQSAVGQYLNGLLGEGAEAGAGGDTLEIKLPPWVEKFANKLLGALLPVVFAIAIGIVLIAAALAAFIVLLGVGVLVVLVAIGFAIAAIAATLAFIGMVIGVFLFRVLMSIADGIEALMGAFVDFIRDPGAFIAKLAKGLASAISSIFGSITEAIGKAFEDISILNTIDETFKAFGGTLTKIFDKVADIFGKIVELVGAILESLIPPIEVISALVTAILAVLGTALLVTIIKILATVSSVEAWFKAGGLFGNKAERAAADKAASDAYGSTVASFVEVIKSTSATIENPKIQGVMDTVAKTVGDVAMGKSYDPGPNAFDNSSDSGAPPSNITNTVIQAVPGFYGIPIFGGGF